MDAVSKAISGARYNDAVVITVTDDQQNDREVVLVAALDETNGGIVWQDAGVGGSDGAIARHLRTKRWVFPMLNDRTRNEMYDEAIQKACERVLQENHHGNIEVLDIGSGTGLLAMLASKCLGEASKERVVRIHSLEMASAMARIARKTVASNGLDSTIQVLEQHSCETSLQGRVHLCVSELLESGLLGEGIIPALRDAWDRHLQPNATVVPQRARVFAQVWESQEIINHCACVQPLVSTKDSGEPIRLSTSGRGENAGLLKTGSNGVIVPIHADCLTRDATPLTEPAMVMEFDFTQPKSVPGSLGGSRSTTVTPTRSGRAHGVLFWWELDLWEDITYSTKSGVQEWQDHWEQCVYVFASVGDECSKLEEGKGVDLVCSHDDTKLSFRIQDRVERLEKRQRIEEESTAYLSSLRVMQLNDVSRIQTIRKALDFALSSREMATPVLDLSDFSLGGILAALGGATNVTSLESLSGELPMMSARVAQIGNGLPKQGSTFQIVQSYAENITVETLGGRPAEVVVAEPYYELLEGWHVEEALNFHYLLKASKGRGVVSDKASVIPAFASIKACAIECPLVYKAYNGCGDVVCGFDHRDVNAFGYQYKEHGLFLPMWQYPYRCISETVELGKLSYDAPEASKETEEPVSIVLQEVGTCHAVMYWVDYGFRVDQEDPVSLTTKDRRHRQGICFLPSIVSCSNNERLELGCWFRFGGLPNHESHKLVLSLASTPREEDPSG